MSIKNIKIPKKIRPVIFNDSRGFFQEIFLEKFFKFKIKFTAISKSKKNVIRGLHYQTKNKQFKLLYVAEGKILDVAVNLKSNSKNFGKVFKFYLKEGDMIFIPKYYAHGFECLTKTCRVIYHLGKYREPNFEGGIKYNDKKLKINWVTKRPVLSQRDKNHIDFETFKKNIKSL